jgi:hypothetical protein
MPEDEAPRVLWTASIKKATFTQKLAQDGTSHTRLQIVCEGDTLPVEGIAQLALLQNENLVLITIEPAQLSFAWSAAQKGEEVNAEVPNEGTRSGSGADQAADDPAFSIPGV